MRTKGTLRVALAFAALLLSLSLVVRRQSVAYALLKQLDAARRERAVIESDRSRLNTQAQRLESRARIADVAERWWGMRAPQTDEEIVILQRPAEAPGSTERRGTGSIVRASLLPLGGGSR